MAQNGTVQNGILRVLVWGRWLRIAHWLIAMPTMILIATGWLIENSPSVETGAIEIHQMVAPLLVFGLAIRFVLLFIDKESGNWRAIMPDPQWSQMGQMLRFYLSFGRMPLPRWHAHNPLWAPVYFVMIALLVLAVLSGYVQTAQPLLFGIYLPGLHQLLATLLGWFTLLHLIAVVLHDTRGTGSDISAMLNGYRIFPIDEQNRPDNTPTPSVSINQIGRGNKPGD